MIGRVVTISAADLASLILNFAAERAGLGHQVNLESRSLCTITAADESRMFEVIVTPGNVIPFPSKEEREARARG